MRRRIEFRVWDKLNECMVYFDASGFTANDIGELKNSLNDYNDTHILIKEPLMQFTGLFDKNGREIYEGDIVRHMGKFDHEVIYKNGSFGYQGSMPDDVISYFSNGFNLGLNDGQLFKVEVVGNIYLKKYKL